MFVQLFSLSLSFFWVSLNYVIDFSSFEIDEDLFAEEIVNFHLYTRHQSVVWTFSFSPFFSVLIKMFVQVVVIFFEFSFKEHRGIVLV